MPILQGQRDLKSQTFRDYDFDLFGSCEVISHVTVELAILWTYPQAVHCDHAPILRRYGDIAHHILWGYDVDFFKVT